MATKPLLTIADYLCIPVRALLIATQQAGWNPKFAALKTAAGLKSPNCDLDSLSPSMVTFSEIRRRAGPS